MGQKVNPIGIRLGITTNADSVWYADSKDYANYLNEDIKIRKYLHKKLKNAAISSIGIERPTKDKIAIKIFAARPGIIIGKKGGDVEDLRKELSNLLGGTQQVYLTVEEVRKPDLDAKLVAENVAQQLERRVMYRKAMKRAIQNCTRAGALGVKIMVSGRLGGAEIARSEWQHEGQVPLHTLRADISYGVEEAKTTYGIIGVKCWIFKGEKLAQDASETEKSKSKKKQG
jgi:small subunit ribosomal protein S3